MESLSQAIAAMSAEAVSPEQIKQVAGHLDNWDGITFEDRRHVVDVLVSTINATSDDIDISWKF